MSILFLKNLLQMPVACAGSVSKFCSAFFHEQLSLSPGIIFFGEYPLEFSKYFVFFTRHALPTFFQPVDWITLKTRDDGLKTTEVFYDPQFLGDVDPGFEDSRSLVRF